MANTGHAAIYILRRGSQAPEKTYLVEIENEVQFTYVAEVSVKHLHEVMHKLQCDQLIVTAVNAHDEI